MHVPRPSRLLRTAGAAVVAAAILFPAAVATVSAAAVPDRTFTCAGNAGDIYTQYTIAGSLTRAGIPRAVTTTQVATAASVVRAGKAVSLGASVLQTGYTTWDITAANPNGDTYTLHVSPVLPGGGGFFDALLEIQYAGGASGGNQIPMFDCAVTGGPVGLAHPAGSRAFSCTGSLGLARTITTVAGSLNSANRPSSVVVTAVSTGVVESTRKLAAKIGPSWLHAGFTSWNVTGGPAATSGDIFNLHIPPVLPAAGGFFDADLEILFAGGANGGWQIPMFDCTVK